MGGPLTQGAPRIFPTFSKKIFSPPPGEQKISPWPKRAKSPFFPLSKEGKKFGGAPPRFVKNRGGGTPNPGEKFWGFLRGVFFLRKIWGIGAFKKAPPFSYFWHPHWVGGGVLWAFLPPKPTFQSNTNPHSQIFPQIKSSIYNSTIFSLSNLHHMVCPGSN